MSVLRSCGSLIGSQNLMQQVDLHKSVFPLSIVLVNCVKFVITLVLLLFVVMIFGHTPNWTWLALIPLLLVEVFLIAGLSCGAAAISPFFPDFRIILETALHLMFFLSGIFFELDRLPERFSAVLDYNPMAVLIVAFRKVLLHGQWPEWGSLSIPLIEAVAILFVAMIMLRSFNKVYPKLS